MDFNLTEYLRFMALAIVPFFFAITVHELSHGFVAYRLGDDTAKNAGRLTLNPFAHIDIFGLLFLLITRLFGWAKPVPVNFGNLRNKKYGMAIVAFAGPASNLIIAVISAILLRLIEFIPVQEGSTAFQVIYPLYIMIRLSVQINVALAIFNMIPILPLDGGRILFNFLPMDKAMAFAKTEQYGFFIILALFLTNVFDRTVLPVIRFCYQLLL
ncbi:site-2 protease family protein [Limisalsivibrio acetivorans]|uniref:site-2 protease family protein n=1 Tax=Limisalsivibrio acetivorans TaxID=1304888 RepID=UPI0004797742|nr:site-2 protease family protein [Limisalsivibrio acetivorans]